MISIIDKDYKSRKTGAIMNKGGQVAIFVVVAIAIVALIIVLFVYPRRGGIIGSSEQQDPVQFLRSCLEPDVKEAVEELSAKGGSFNPTLKTAYQGGDVEYLCYTASNYEPCVVQQPLLTTHFSEELERRLDAPAKDCMSSLRESFENRGYQVSSGQQGINVTLSTGAIRVEYLSALTITKDTTQTFQKPVIAIKSELYDLLMIATSILQFESELGNSETDLYISYYPDLRVEKMKRTDDTIYTLSNVVTGESFRFATRSLVWPPGYDFGGSQ